MPRRVRIEADRAFATGKPRRLRMLIRLLIPLLCVLVGVGTTIVAVEIQVAPPYTAGIAAHAGTLCHSYENLVVSLDQKDRNLALQLLNNPSIINDECGLVAIPQPASGTHHS
jgi:hypothetical protein